jgi:hypothetical protein
VCVERERIKREQALLSAEERGEKRENRVLRLIDRRPRFFFFFFFCSSRVQKSIKRELNSFLSLSSQTAIFMTRNLVAALARRARSSQLSVMPTRGGGGGPVALNKPAAKEVRLEKKDEEEEGRLKKARSARGRFRAHL